MEKKKAMNHYRKAILVRFVSLSLIILPGLSQTRENILANQRLGGSEQMTSLSKTEFEIIEGKFHDGLGTYAELSLANALIAVANASQPLFDLRRSKAKMVEAIGALPEGHPSRITFQKEIVNIEKGSQQGAIEILNQSTQDWDTQAAMPELHSR
jgi:hypothetical protein